MTGQGHRLTGLGAAFFAAAIARMAGWEFQAQLGAGVIAAFSTTVPDWIEIPVKRNNKVVSRLITHRTLTHWGILWVVLLFWGASLNGMGAMALVGMASGSLFHLLGDAPNPMGIPWLWPTRRVKIGKNGLWRSGQNELFMIAFLTGLGYFFWLFSEHHAGALAPFLAAIHAV